MRLPLIASLLTISLASRGAAEPVDYARDVKPLLARQCVTCHDAKTHKGGLRLDTAAGIRKGGKSGTALVSGKSAESLLIQAIEGASGMTRMPYKRSPLAAEQVALLKRWIDAGAAAPAQETSSRATHWAFIAPTRSPVPEVKNRNWVRNPIDRFVLAKLEQEGFVPSPEADRGTLLRRVYLDLIGLPPSVAEVEAFRSDPRPDAYERVVDRLLASPHYGERWGRHWLDLARYADSNGYSIDAPREIWKYRDWVIDALNRDMSFQEFVIEQIAGDMLPHPTTEQQVATGFHRNTQINQEGGIDVEQFRVEAVADRVATTGSVFLGLTLGCARCHDHKFDPISQKEYYQLFAFFNNQDEPTLALASPDLAAKREAVQNQIEKLAEEYLARQEAWSKNLTEEQRTAIPKNIQVILRLGFEQRDRKQKQAILGYFKRRDADLYARLRTIDDLEKAMPKFPTTMVLRERAKPRETHIHISGDFTRPGELVSAGVPSVLPSLAKKNANRLDLAQWLVDRKNPLAARVAVNRLWEHYFGKGLVETENDFGTQGSLPTHPELLDWLAVEFMDRGWSLKEMHRVIVTSATYRQSSRYRADLAKADPYNHWLGRQARLRLDAEIVRDEGLAVCGLLNHQIGGPSVFPPQPDGVFRFTQVPREWKADAGPQRFRRGIYTYFWRAAPYPALTVFDAPDATSTCTRRVRSNTPLQALTLLNDTAFLEFAQAVAKQTLKTDGDHMERLRQMFETCLSRRPNADEEHRLERLFLRQLLGFRNDLAAARDLVAAHGDRDVDLPEYAAWTAVARVLLNLDEFITRE